jgi:hypothetical protein
MPEDRQRLYHARDVVVMRSVLTELTAIFRAVLVG